MGESSGKSVITFDDFGISETANERMLELLSSGKVHRVSVMMNGILKSQDVQALLRSGVRIDIHLDRKHTINEYRKLKEGALHRLVCFLYNYAFGSARPSMVEEVWEEQIRRFQEVFQKLPDGLNSHEHVHFFPPYFHRMLRLAKKHQIEYVRFGSERSKNYNAVALILNCLRCLNRRAFVRSKLPSSNFLVSWDWIAQHDFSAYIRDIAPGKTMEIIFHPERSEEYTFLKKL